MFLIANFVVLIICISLVYCKVHHSVYLKNVKKFYNTLTSVKMLPVMTPSLGCTLDKPTICLQSTDCTKICADPMQTYICEDNVCKQTAGLTCPIQTHKFVYRIYKKFLYKRDCRPRLPEIMSSVDTRNLNPDLCKNGKFSTINALNDLKLLHCCTCLVRKRGLFLKFPLQPSCFNEKQTPFLYFDVYFA
ncbi:per os infectivity factor pif-3 [Cotesia congregata filamentous virus 1]|uniref:Per os infectivity factor pif-3 n=1 Tax=Cotesia congregata filamentous virus 1 TaxID=3064291 RepID=A0ABC8QKL6_9VIRU|nr:per os infectivity factor pif-3 [Cotesia congregata filamentous virus 1]